MNRGIYFLRVRNINSPIVDMYSEKKRCILYTKYGCKFDYIHRPSGGKYLIPSNRFYTVNNHKVRACHLKYTIMDCCYEWEPYQKVLEELVQYFKEKDIQCSL